MSGVVQDRKSLDIIEGSLRPLRDGIVVKPIPVKLSIILNAERKGSFRGEVLAVGPGEYPNIYSKDRSKVRRSKHFTPTEIKVGDIVELGGQEHATGYAFPRLMLNGEEVILATEKDVAGVHS